MKKAFVYGLLCCLLLTACHSSRRLASGEKALTRKAIINTAKRYLGCPYVYGGTTPKGFDCSGFVNYVFEQHGIKLPRISKAQSEYRKAIPLRKAQPADLIFFTGRDASGPVGHVGIITKADGENTEFIHAGSSGKDGGVVMSSLANSYFSKRFVRVVDIISQQ